MYFRYCRTTTALSRYQSLCLLLVNLVRNRCSGETVSKSHSDEYTIIALNELLLDELFLNFHFILYNNTQKHIIGYVLR